MNIYNSMDKKLYKKILFAYYKHQLNLPFSVYYFPSLEKNKCESFYLKGPPGSGDNWKKYI